jgi:CHASE2 domain-containing sensor protein
MQRQQGITVLLLMLGMASISLGMALKNIFEYSPTVGCLLGTLILIVNSIYTCKNIKKKSNT